MANKIAYVSNMLTEEEFPVLYSDLGDGNYAPVVSSQSTGGQREIVMRFLDTDGDGTGTKNAVGDYSDVGAGAEIFYIQPPDGVVYRLARILPCVVDSGSFDSGNYGNGVSLTNGISLRVQDDDGTVLDLLDGLTIKTNVDWARHCYDITVSNFGAGNEYMNGRWTFSKSGQYIRLDGSNNERLELVLNDDYSGLVEHYFMVQGYIE